MVQMKRMPAGALALACTLAWSGLSAHADHKDDRDRGREVARPKRVFVIATENHNWTQPNPTSSAPADLHESGCALHQ
jgi:hypothetical protein